MPIPIKPAKRSQPGVKGGGQFYYCALQMSRGRVSLLELSKEISTMCSLSRPDVVATLEALTEMLPEFITNGHIVELGGLGTIGPQISSKPSTTAHEVFNGNIRCAKAKYRPGKEIKALLKNCTFEMVKQ